MEEIKCSNQVCKLCGDNRYSCLYTKNFRSHLGINFSFEIVRCYKCKLVYAVHSMKTVELIDYYRNYEDRLYLQEEESTRRSARIILGKLRKIKKSGRLLDIGCAAGFLLDEARKFGYEVMGVELSREAVNHAKEKLNLSIFSGTISEISFPPDYFDIITIIDVIEHLSEPLECLVKIKRILKPGGILYITTPDIESWLSRIFKSRWKGIRSSHLFYFSRKTMQSMLERAGFDVVRSGRYARTHSFEYWLGRAALYSRFITFIFKIIFKMCSFGLVKESSLLTINFFDHLEFFATKINR